MVRGLWKGRRRQEGVWFDRRKEGCKVARNKHLFHKTNPFCTKAEDVVFAVVGKHCFSVEFQLKATKTLKR